MLAWSNQPTRLPGVPQRSSAEDPMSLESQLWREVSQHLELDESVRRIAKILAEHIPLRALSIRRLERDPMRLTLVASASLGEEPDPDGGRPRVDLSERAAPELTRLFRADAPALLASAAPELTRALGLGDLGPPVVALCLTVEERPVGLALLHVEPGSEVRPEHLASLLPVQRPLGVAFENDQRLHELSRMRAALEADREALLSRLHRREISEAVIGAAGGLSPVMDRVHQVAPTDAPVLILGETGSGKEVIARAIHSQSRRAQGPVVRVNCGAMPPELIDSELFGHERGAFTGASAQRKGWFERADGGTLFLDEIGELPLAAQVRLLRVLQDGTLERVGGHQTISVDVRVVAATHRQLESMVATGAFREDLWYRLSVFPIRLPALRERMEDLPALAEYFAERAGRRLGGAGLAPTSADLLLLERYPWPGNVRELGTVIERAAILGSGKRLEVAAALGATSVPPRAPSVAPPPDRYAENGSELAIHNSAGTSGRLPTLDEAMANHIRKALAACEGRIEGSTGAAHLLGINPHTLRARMRKLKVDWATYRVGLRP
jgi:hydrogenase-4 transcriptional activator